MVAGDRRGKHVVLVDFVRSVLDVFPGNPGEEHVCCLWWYHHVSAIPADEETGKTTWVSKEKGTHDWSSTTPAVDYGDTSGDYHYRWKMHFHEGLLYTLPSAKRLVGVEGTSLWADAFAESWDASLMTSVVVGVDALVDTDGWLP